MARKSGTRVDHHKKNAAYIPYAGAPREPWCSVRRAGTTYADRWRITRPVVLSAGSKPSVAYDPRVDLLFDYSSALKSSDGVVDKNIDMETSCGTKQGLIRCKLELVDPSISLMTRGQTTYRYL